MNPLYRGILTGIVLSVGVVAGVNKLQAGSLPIELIKTDRSSVEVRVAGRYFCGFQYGMGFHKPVFFPIYTPMGNSLVREYPIRFGGKGESQDHWHHESMWFTYGNVNGVDFWAKQGQPHDEFTMPSGKIVFNRWHVIQGGDDRGWLAFTADWVRPDGTIVLQQREDVIIRASEMSRTMDFTIRLTAQDDPVTFNDTKEGMFAIRVNPELRENNTGEYINGEGLKKEEQVWGKRSPWIALRGSIDDEKIALVIMEHPASTNHPTYWHARGYGLFAANPFGRKDFKKGSEPINYSIKPGETILFRYRVYIHSGDMTKNELDKAYAAYRQSGERENGL